MFEYHVLGRRFSASLLVFGSHPVDLCGRDGQEEDLLRRTPPPREGFGQEWKIRMMAQKAASTEVANSKLRRLSAYNATFNCADVEIGDGLSLRPQT